MLGVGAGAKNRGCCTRRVMRMEVRSTRLLHTSRDKDGGGGDGMGDMGRGSRASNSTSMEARVHRPGAASDAPLPWRLGA
jgi:hypothetical protein